MTTTTEETGQAESAPGPGDPIPNGAKKRQGLMNITGIVAFVIGLAAAATTLDRTMTATITVFAVVGLLAFVLVTFIASMVVEGRRRAADRFTTTMVYTAFVLAILPLVSIVIKVLTEGYARIDSQFFTETLRGVIGEGGGAAHAIVGTLIITLIAALISIPVGLFTAIYLVEYGNNGRLSQGITFFVDVMTGIPSIVAGLFAFAFFRTITGGFDLPRTGFAGAISLCVLMIPVVVRSCEEMLLLVPDRLRQSSYALGVPKWRTIIKVVIPTASAGIAAGVTISIARVIGETAPLLLTAGFTLNMNYDPFSRFMATLPVYVYFQFTQPGIPPEVAQERAWAAALVLIAIVLLLNLFARLVARAFAPKTR